jgi:hypothetical protein
MLGLYYVCNKYVTILFLVRGSKKHMFRILPFSQLYVHPLPTITPDSREYIVPTSQTLIHVLFTAESVRPCNPFIYIELKSELPYLWQLECQRADSRIKEALPSIHYKGLHNNMCPPLDRQDPTDLAHSALAQQQGK